MQWIIYKHTLTTKCEHFGWSYIGLTMQQPEQRWKNGNGYFRRTKTGQLVVFAKAIEEYGWENFSHEIIEDGIKTLQEAKARERYWIKYYNTYVNDPGCAGYNMTRGGDGSLGFKHSEENRERIKHGVRKAFPYGRCGENHPFYGKNHTEETKQKISKSKRENPSYYWLGRHRSDETKEKLRAANLGKRLTKEQKDMANNKRKDTKKKNGTDKLSWVSIQQFTLDGVLIRTWSKLTDASEALSIAPGNITKVCRGIRKSAGGFRWQYADPNHLQQAVENY